MRIFKVDGTSILTRSHFTNDLPEFPSAALSSIDVATATPHSSALQNENSFYVIMLKMNVPVH